MKIMLTHQSFQAFLIILEKENILTVLLLIK